MLKVVFTTTTSGEGHPSSSAATVSQSARLIAGVRDGDRRQSTKLGQQRASLEEHHPRPMARHRVHPPQQPNQVHRWAGALGAVPEEEERSAGHNGRSLISAGAADARPTGCNSRARQSRRCPAG